MQISVRELKSRLSEYLRKVAAGEELLVTSHGKTVARLLPPARPRRASKSNEAEAIALLHGQSWIRPAGAVKQKIGLSRPAKLKAGAKSMSQTVSEMRD